MQKFSFKMLGICIGFMVLLCGCAGTSVRIATVPPPPSTAKLRVYVVAVTSDVPQAGFWKVPQEQYEDNMFRQTARMLSNKGIYEVVPPADIKTALGDQKIAAWAWKRGDWALAKDAGRALHADYVLCIERSWKSTLQQDLKMFNLQTGRQFSVSNYLPRHLLNDDEAVLEMNAINSRTLFREAQSDLLQTALSKGRMSSGAIQSPPDSKKEAESKPSNVAKKQETQPGAKPLAPRPVQDQPREKRASAEEKQKLFEKELETKLAAKSAKQEGSRLVVYDFEAIEQLNIVGLILAEALREELYKLGGFVLINRENMAQVMEEHKLQESGLVNEKQAIKLGEWMAANEAVTGKIAVIGSSSILQAKRIDIKTLNTIALGSLKCRTGAEDELLSNMRDLAKKLAQLP